MRKVRFGMLGFGEWAKWHARFIRKNPDAELVAVADSEEEKRSIAAKDFGVKVYSDYNQLLKKEKLDVVDVLLPNYLHHKVAIASIKAGYNVLLEKPMALTVKNCDLILNELQGACNQGKRLFLAPGFQLRTSSLWGKVKKLIEEGKVGLVRHVNVEVFRSAPPVGMGSWRLDKEKVGSWMLDAPIHYFDLIRWYFTGMGEAESIYSSANFFSEKALVDNFSSIIKFPAEGYGVISYSMAGYGYYTMAKVIGDKGAIWAHWEEVRKDPPEANFWLEYGKEGERQEIAIERPAGETFDLEAEIGQIVKAVQEGGSLPANGVDGREAVRICLAAEESLRKGEIVKF